MSETKWLPLPITGPPYKLQDEREQDKVSTLLMDCYVDEAGNTIKRPGLELIVDLAPAISTPLDGLYWWDEQEKVVFVAGTNVYFMTDETGTFTVHSILQDLPSGNRVSFATINDGGAVLAASGGRIYKTGVGPLTDPDAPTAVRSLTTYDQYTIAAVEGTGSFAFDEVGSGGASWRAQDVLTAESKPDRLMAVLGTLDGFVLFGRTSTEFWVNDGVTPFSRVRGLTYNRGCGARYSPALYGDTWMWLDEKRNVMKSTLNKLEEVSDPVKVELQALSTVSDAVGDIMHPGGRPFYVLSFPTANRTFVYDINQNHWFEWGYWDAATGTYQRFRAGVYCYCPKWNIHLVGDREVGRVYKLTNEYFTDNTTPIRSVRRTGFITQGTGNKKRVKTLRFRLKRSVANDDVPSPTMQVRWREQGKPWGPTRDVSLGEVGQHEIFVELHNCGEYRARQYEFIHSAATDWILMTAEELVEVMDR